MCGCMRVCDISLEPPWPPYERMIGGIRFARPQYVKMCFLLYKVPLNDDYETQSLNISYRYSQKMSIVYLRMHRAPAVRPQCAKMCFFTIYRVGHLKPENILYRNAQPIVRLHGS